MSFFIKVVRSLTYTKYRNKVSTPSQLFKIQKCSCRNIYRASNLCAKMFLEHENEYAYSILHKKGYTVDWKIPSLDFTSKDQPLTEEQFHKVLQENWSNKTHTEIIDVMAKLGVYCSKNNICISNEIFDNYIDNLTDCLKFATDKELEAVFYSLNKWPEPPSMRTRNYIEVWVALDDECLCRIQKFSHDELLYYTSLFYMLNVTRQSDFSIKTLQKLASKAKQLTPSQLVQTLFYIGVWRTPPFDMHNLEVHLKNNFDKFCIDDLAIMSMGFFKSKTPLRDMDLVLNIINAVIDNAKSIHEVSLAALLKIIRYSTRLVLDDRIGRLLDTLQHEVPRLSVMCNVHIALVGTATLNFHKSCLTKIAETVNKSIHETRMKDLERLVLTFGTFNFVPKTNPCLLTNIIKELSKPERQEEIEKHGRAFACCVGYFGLVNIYPVDLIRKVLNPLFLKNAYGTQIYYYGREILALNNFAQLFCSNDHIDLLNKKTVKLLAKKYTDYVPSTSHPRQFNVTEKMILDIMTVLGQSRGGQEFVVGEHVVPHHQRGDIIICNDLQGNPVPVNDKFPPEDFGQLRRVPDNNVWIALVVAGRNALIQNSDISTGFFQSKLRELKVLGYHATIVPWSLYSKLETSLEKINFLNRLIAECLENNNN